MKIQLWSVGKTHEPYVRDGIEDFTKRINKYFTAEWMIIPPVKNAAVLSEADLKKSEAIAIQSYLQKEDYLILLDERGKQLTSPELAKQLQQLANESNKRIVFLIGGAFGVPTEVGHNLTDQKWLVMESVYTRCQSSASG